ncbi:MAG: hypothetical protein ABW200_04535, partial [Hyphomicrobiaceae bacterium]
LLKTLNVGNIPTGVSYEQFVQRGLQPSFDEIAETGRRLQSLRARLGTVTEMIETSALVGQSAATRHNTAVLRNATTILISILGIVLLRFTFPKVWAAISNWFHALLGQWDTEAAALVTDLLNLFGPWVVPGAILSAAGVSILYALYQYVVRTVLWRRQRQIEEPGR